jgi:hypothetical protein
VEDIKQEFEKLTVNMKKINLLLAFILISSSVFAQYADALEYGKTITSSDLKKHLTILASDEYEGRETGKKGQRMAAEYIANHFKSLGIAPIIDKGYYQEVPLISNSWKKKEFSINQKKQEFAKDFYAFPGTELVETTNDIVFIGYGIESENYNDLAGVDIKGKIVLMFNGEPVNKKGKYAVTNTSEPSKFGKSIYSKLDSIKAKEPKAILLIDEEIEENTKKYKDYLYHSSVKLDDPNVVKNFPVLYISPKLANEFVNLNKSGITKLQESLRDEPNSALYIMELKDKINKRNKPNSFYVNKTLNIGLEQFRNSISSENVLGYIKGSDLSDEVIVITAHYDHIGIEGDVVFNGADDDGSGTVALLEIAEAFQQAKKAGKGPRRSILIMGFTGEEKGLLGSKHYTTYPVFPLYKTVANLNIDMIGRVDEAHEKNREFVYLIGSDRLSKDLHEISEKANKDYVNIKLDYTFNDENDPNRFYYRSDHYNFAKNNVPVIFYFNGVHADYHKETDTVDKIQFDLMEKRSQLVFYTAWELANRDERIKVDKAP